MNILIFGATGMVGSGVLRECLQAADVKAVQTVGRTATGIKHPKLSELVLPDLTNYIVNEDRLKGFDACYFCLGVSASGMTEKAYTLLTYDVTLSAANTLVRLNPQMTFVYVSGWGTDSTEAGRSMWARVKGKTENALMRLPFKAVYLFRPSAIQPLHGTKSKTNSYRIIYTIAKPFFPLLLKLFPNSIVTTESMGLAMLQVTRKGWAKSVLNARDINIIARS